MKPWDGRDLPQAIPQRLSRRDRARLARLFGPRAETRRAPPHVSSVIGLVLAVGVLAGLAWLLSPAQAVSSKILH